MNKVIEMKVRALKNFTTTLDGSIIKHAKEGDILEVRQFIGCKLLREGSVEPIKEGK